MSDEEKVRAVLRAQVDSIEPSPSGWDRIKDGIVVRRRRRLWLRSSLAAATALSLVAVVAVTATRDGDGRPNEIIPASQAPSPDPTTAPAPAADGTAAIGVWPLTIDAEVDAWHPDSPTYPYLADVDAAAERFAREYLGIAKPILRKPPAEAQGVARQVYRTIDGTDQQIAVTEVSLRSAAPHTVLGVRGGSIDVTSITSGATSGGEGVASPLVVRGTFKGVGQPIDVLLRAAPSAGGGEIAKVRAEIGPDGWTATLTFTTTAKTGSLLATTYSNADGGLADAFAVPVSFGIATAPTPVAAPTRAPMSGVYPAQFVAVEKGRLAVFETKTAKRVRYLTERDPGGGASDPSVTPDGEAVVYVQGEGTCAASIRRVPLAGGDPEILVRSNGTSVPLTPVLSSRDDLAYIEEFCQREDSQVVVRPTAPAATSARRTIDPGSDASLYALAWSPDGTTLAVVDVLTLDSPAQIFLVNPKTHRRVEEGKKLPHPAEPEGADCGWSEVGYGDDGVLYAVQNCYSEIADAGSFGGRVIEFEPSGPRVMFSTGDVIAWFDVDGTGDHIVLGALACGETCEGADESVQRFSVDGEPVKVADGLTQPAWVE